MKLCNWKYKKQDNESPFEKIKHIDSETGEEFWYARELMVLLGYTKWQNFRNAISKATTSLEVSGFSPTDHITEVGKPYLDSANREQSQEDFKLSRYGAYVVIQNCDPRKKQVAQGQSYFSISAITLKQNQELVPYTPHSSELDKVTQAVIQTSSNVDKMSQEVGAHLQSLALQIGGVGFQLNWLLWESGINA